MTHEDSLTIWLHAAAQGDSVAAQALYERVFDQLVRLARQRLSPRARRAADEEDVALSAFDSFLAGARRNRFPQLQDRHDLWKVLLAIVLRKAVSQNRRERRLKRGGGEVRGESVFVDGTKRGARGLEQFVSEEVTPAMAVAVREELEKRLEALDNEQHRQIVLLKLEGFTNEEISTKLDCSLRTVERRLERIRNQWTE